MLHPLLALAAARPQLLAEHASAWAELLSTQAGPAWAHWQRWRLLQLLAGSCLILGVLLAGMALMLWAVVPNTPWLPSERAWALLVVPALPLLAGLACALAARQQGRTNFWGADGTLGRQLQADLSLLRQFGESQP